MITKRTRPFFFLCGNSVTFVLIDTLKEKEKIPGVLEGEEIHYLLVVQQRWLWWERRKPQETLIQSGQCIESPVSPWDPVSPTLVIIISVKGGSLSLRHTHRLGWEATFLLWCVIERKPKTERENQITMIDYTHNNCCLLPTSPVERMNETLTNCLYSLDCNIDRQFASVGFFPLLCYFDYCSLSPAIVYNCVQLNRAGRRKVPTGA